MNRNKEFGYLAYILASLLGSMILLILIIGAVEIVNASPSSTWQYQMTTPTVLGMYPAVALERANPGDWDQLVFSPRAGELVTVKQNITLTVPPVVSSTVAYQPSEVGQNLHQSLQVWKSGQLVKSFSWPVTVLESIPPDSPWTYTYGIGTPTVRGIYPAAILERANPGDWDQLVFSPRAGELVTVTQNVTLTVPPVVSSTVVYQPSEVGQVLHQSLQVWKSGQLVKSFSWPVAVREPSPPENGSNLSCDPNSGSSLPGDTIFCQLPPTTSLQAVVQSAVAHARGVSIDAVPTSETTIISIQWTSGSQNILKLRAANEDPTFARLRRADTPVMATLNTNSGLSYVLQEGERGQWQVFVPLTQR